MALRDLFGKAKSTAKKAESKADDIYDREIRGGMEAHRRGSKAVGERFGRANAAAGEYAERSFGFGENSDFASGFTDGDLDLLGDDSSSQQATDRLTGGGGQQPALPDAMGDPGNQDSQPGTPDLIGENDSDDRLW